ncbi:hypothetical protein CYMTET_35344, partial [Cymbomonas tetramitiformis]
ADVTTKERGSDIQREKNESLPIHSPKAMGPSIRGGDEEIVAGEELRVKLMGRRKRAESLQLEPVQVASFLETRRPESKQEAADEELQVKLHRQRSRADKENIPVDVTTKEMRSPLKNRQLDGELRSPLKNRQLDGELRSPLKNRQLDGEMVSSARH